MKNTIKWFLKAIAAGVLALLVASAACLIYYNPGIHVTNPSGVTDYVWQSNSFSGTMTEGIAWNRTDKNGFYNETTTDKNMNVLLMGSSQMEGTNVFPKQNAAWLLGEYTGKTTYNIGTSGHDLLVCVKNLKTALTVMQPTEYVVIEIGTPKYSEKAIEDCLSGKMANIPSYDSGLLFHLQKIPYLKLVYAQLASWDGVGGNNAPSAQTNSPSTTIEASLMEAYEQLTAEISRICVDYGVQPVIVYHPHLSVNADGTVALDHDEAYLDAFASACQANEVLFVDMTEDFLQMYHTEYVLPHGFCNTAVGVGHLNQHGHKAIAERLAEVISANEGE